MSDPNPIHEVLRPAELSGRQRYELLTSLVVPRPIGWLSTRSNDGVRNLAPFSFFGALSVSPMLVGVSIGHRRAGPKDTLENIRQTGAFCVNVVTVDQLEPMNESSTEFAPAVDEFAHTGLGSAEAGSVNAPYVADCPAVLECRLFREVGLGEAPNTLILGEVLAVRLSPSLRRLEATHVVDPDSLRPVGRLWGSAYAMPGCVRRLRRPPRPDSEKA